MSNSNSNSSDQSSTAASKTSTSRHWTGRRIQQTSAVTTSTATKGSPPTMDITQGPAAINLGSSSAKNRFSGHTRIQGASSGQKITAGRKPSNNQDVPVKKSLFIPATEFLHFPNLPAELRLKVWKHAAHDPRLIEMAHMYFKAILHVNMESRAEAMKFYEIRKFDSYTDTIKNDCDRWTYYNPVVDTLYFGPNSCISSIFEITESQSGLNIPSIAFEMTEKIAACCHIYNRLGVGPIQELGLNLIHGSYDPCHALCLLTHIKLRGVHGLKDIIFIVPSTLWRVRGGEITQAVGLRSATHDGLTRGQQMLKERVLSGDLEISVPEFGGPSGVGTDIGHANRTNEKKPRLHFRSLAPKVIGLDTRIYDSLPISKREICKLGRVYGFLKSIERQTGCVVTLPGITHWELQKEIGFFGERTCVERAKAQVLERLGDSYVGIVDFRDRHL